MLCFVQEEELREKPKEGRGREWGKEGMGEMKRAERELEVVRRMREWGKWLVKIP